MKIQCDVCDGEEATVFCSADEAALCAACDRRVHHANKLAGKHLRFSLLRPSSSKQAPLCDICKERRAFVFCKEDRAILCRECDIPIHRANEQTQNHNRFLLTGVKLSAASSPFPATTSGSDPPTTNSPRSLTSTPEQNFSETGSAPTSSISEYLETLPGWCFDDFLAPPATDSNRFCKSESDDCEVVLSSDLGCDMGLVPSGSLSNWVAGAPVKSESLPERNGDGRGFKVGRKRRDDTETLFGSLEKRNRYLW